MRYNLGMAENDLTLRPSDWQEQVTALQVMLDELLAKLVDAEAELAERLASIHAFEYRLRTALSHLTRKMDELDRQIADLRRQLRWYGDAWYDGDDGQAATWARGHSAAEEGEYKYHEAPREARPVQDEDTRAELKKLYRQLARYYHPDTAVDEEDREYRTQMMMAINAAYAAGDLEKLRQLADSPEMVRHLSFDHPDQQLAEALQREIERIKQRLAEIEQEMKRLNAHESARMMRKMAEAEAQGRDYLGELKQQMQETIVRKMVDRDSLQVQLESLEFGDEDLTLSDDELADIVAQVTLETSFDEDISPEFDSYIRRRTDRVYFEDDFDDDMDFE